ncbi:MAG TPA: hypothetical protein VKB57_14450 [Acidimicrobiales bacterium]|nr:hypothetical protein [Acidimicrobiales bacterium]
MADIVDLSALLEQIRGFSPLQRILLATAGTLQGALSAYFGAPVTIEVRSQSLQHTTVHREVDLVCKELDLVACSAVTEIEVRDPRIRELIADGTVGLGQIVALLGVRANFELVDVGSDDGTFWRRYHMAGDGFDYLITETFPVWLYGGT